MFAERQINSVQISYRDWFDITGCTINNCLIVHISLERLESDYCIDLQGEFPVMLTFSRSTQNQQEGIIPSISVFGKEYACTRFLWKLPFDQLFRLWQNSVEQNPKLLPLSEDYAYYQCFHIAEAIYTDGSPQRLCSGCAEESEAVIGDRPVAPWGKLLFISGEEPYLRFCTNCMGNARNSH